MSLAAQAEAELARWGLLLAFPPELEAQYRLDTAPERAREQRRFFRIALALYVGIGILLKLAGVTHESWQDCALQLGGAGAVILLLVQHYFQQKISDPTREAVALACCLTGSLAAILVTYSKPATTQDLIIAALPANFVLMFMRLRFPFAAVFALVTFASYAASILLRPGLAPPQQGFLIMFMAILCLPALIGVHSLERASRRLYLHGLLQRLRITHMAAENNALTALSMTDALTQTANRRRLDEALRSFCADKAPGGAMLLVDVDRFKAFNDRHGHQAGDLCLQQVARCLSAHLRRRDLLARFGGEEFAVLLAGVSAPEAASMAERLRAAVEAYPFVVENVPFGVTVSIGIALRGGGATAKSLIEAADIALYAAKSAGRNQVRALTD